MRVSACQPLSIKNTILANCMTSFHIRTQREDSPRTPAQFAHKVYFWPWMTLASTLKVIPHVRLYSRCNPEHFAYKVDIWPWVPLTLTFKVIRHLPQDSLCYPTLFTHKLYFWPWMTLTLILKVIPPVLQYSPCDSEHFAYNVDFWPWVTLTLTFKVIHLFLFVSGWSHWLKYFKPERNPFTSKSALIFRLIIGLSNLFDFCEKGGKKLSYYEDIAKWWNLAPRWRFEKISCISPVVGFEPWFHSAQQPTLSNVLSEHTA